MRYYWKPVWYTLYILPETQFRSPILIMISQVCPFVRSFSIHVWISKFIESARFSVAHGRYSHVLYSCYQQCSHYCWLCVLSCCSSLKVMTVTVNWPQKAMFFPSLKRGSLSADHWRLNKGGFPLPVAVCISARVVKCWSTKERNSTARNLPRTHGLSQPCCVHRCSSVLI